MDLTNLIIKGNEIKEAGFFGKTIYVIKGNEIKEPGLFGKTVYVIKGNEIKEPGLFGKTLYTINGNSITYAKTFSSFVERSTSNLKEKTKDEKQNNNKEVKPSSYIKTETKKESNITKESSTNNKPNNGASLENDDLSAKVYFLFNNANDEYILNNREFCEELIKVYVPAFVKMIKGIRKIDVKSTIIDLSDAKPIVNFVYKYYNAVGKLDLKIDQVIRRQILKDAFHYKKEVDDVILDECDYWDEVNNRKMSELLYDLIKDKNN